MTTIGTAAHAAAIAAERARREAGLRSPDGWLTLVGLAWLREGYNRFGTAPDNDVVLPPAGAIERAGAFRLDGARVEVEGTRDAGVLLDDRPVTDPLPVVVDDAGPPSVVRVGRLRLTIIRRAGRTGVRMRDPDSPVRMGYHGLEAFPVDARWRREARVERYDPPRKVLVPTILGDLEPDEVTMSLVFEVDGSEHRLDAFELPDGSLEVMFRDATNGKETYEAGRFLPVDAPVDERAVVDFNRAYDAPCVFTPYATCPLPLPQNTLPFRVDAGERHRTTGH